ncbi:Serine/threonine-protein kinase [Maudiozyma exigua]|uniref:non-specific serine/threonine protein kinase n=1 Tax=Maudiozyma exigua TaxID=34358 RepID=A0A9P7BA00_MAUEX|nr:Serine/threonine-protein kinase [Kazachstania exigua]
MGVQLSILAQSSPSIGIFSYIDVLEDVHYTALLNSSRFLKTCKAVDPNGEIIIKVFIKPREGYSLESTVDALKRESLLLSQLPNVLNYSKIVESNRAGYLIRQHLRRNLYDRLSSRPYLQDIESKFIAFQILQTLKDIHQLDIVHTDIKTENIMVNSWNWVALTDFASHVKPIYLPEDNPGEFSFYFDTSKRRNCYIAPERFNTQLYNESTTRHNPSKEMDIFSAGCCIAELFSEGIPIFNLSQLFKYKNGEYDVNEYLEDNFTGNEELKSLILDMVQLDPSRRLSAVQLLEKYRDILFPDYFYNFTYDYFRTLASLITSIPSAGTLTENCNLEDKQNICDNSLLKVYNDFEQICTSLTFPLMKDESKLSSRKRYTNIFFSQYIKIEPDVLILLKNFSSYKNVPAVNQECALLFISYLSRMLRNLTTNSIKIKCLELLAAFSQFISDDNRIDRVIPYFETCFEDDKDPILQALSLQCICQVLETVEQINKLNENVFMDYLLPRIKKLLNRSKDHPYLRMILANLIGNFTTLVSKFRELSISSSLNSNTPETVKVNTISNNHYNGKLMQQIEGIIILLLTDSNVWVKISLLNNVLSLCKHLGKEKTNDIILSHLITYLNDRNALLRLALVEAISGIAILLGPVTLEQYILPLLIQTLTDSEELVVTATLETLHDLCKTGLVNQTNIFAVAKEISPLLLHPNYSIHQFSLVTLHDISQQLSKPDLYCNLYPIIRPYFGFEVEFDLDIMLDSCKRPVSRTVFNLLCSWSLRASNSLFWKQVSLKEVDAFGNPTSTFITKDYVPKNYGLGHNMSRHDNTSEGISNTFVKAVEDSEVTLSAEDKLWIDKFKTLGMKDADLWKLTALRSYILKIKNKAGEKSDLNLQENGDNLDKLYASIGTANVMPHNVFYDIKFIEQETDELTDNKTSKDEVPLQPSHDLPPEREIAPSVINLNGSLILRNKPSATAIPNLQNIYVQLEPNKNHKKVHEQKSASKLVNEKISIPKYTVLNSYNGDVESITRYLNSINVTPNLSDYKEFGFISNSLKEDEKPLGTISGKMVCSLTTNIRNLVVAICTSTGSRSPYVVTGSLQGVISIYLLKNIIKGGSYEPELMFSCTVSVTNVLMLKGYDAFAVSTTDGLLKIYRLFQYDPLHESRKSTFVKEIREFNLRKSSSDAISNRLDKEEHVTLMGEYITDENAYIICLTNKSRILYLDIRKSDNAHFIKTPVSHGGITTFCSNEKSNVLILGTTKGIIDVWDLRLEILVNSWAFDDNSAIKEIKLMEQLGKNMILVVGGSSKDILSIWNYAKIQCRLIIALPGESPSIEKFQPLTKRLDELKYKEKEVNSTISTVHAQGMAVIFSNNKTSDIIMLDLANTNNSTVLLGPSKRKLTFVARKGTVNTTILSIQANSELTPEVRSGKISSSWANIVTTMATVQKQEQLYLIAGDNSGVINIYR